MGIIEITESEELVPTDKFSYGQFNFTQFNPVQSAVYNIFENNNNCLIASHTGSGKTCVAEMYIAHEVRKRGGKGIYLSPLKALSQEKLDEWSDKKHHFSDLKISICTGDYQITPDRKKELDNADIIIMTYEILNSLSRSRSTKNSFLRGDITLVIDEIHNIASNRGTHIEIGLLNFLKINSNPRIVLLSATLPNYKQIGEWLSSVTLKDTFVLQSNYRPCALTRHYEKVKDKSLRYEDKEDKKIDKAMEIVKHYKNDKFILFVHTKATGRKMFDRLLLNGIKSEYHNADLDKEKRMQIENDFRNNKDLRVLVATSGLSAGVNTPARRVVSLGVHSGLCEVDVNMLNQMAGRAGRPKFDTEGDVHFLLPETKFDEWQHRLENPPDIMSALIGGNMDYRHLAFHVVSEIHHGVISNRVELHEWFRNTLSYFQNKKLDDKFVDDMLDSLKKSSILKEEDGSYILTALGKISSMLYFSPYDVADLYRNFDKLFLSSGENDDYCLSCALANIDTHKNGIASKIEVEETDAYKITLSKKKVDCDKKNISVVKIGFCYYLLLNGKDNVILANPMRGLQYDFDRIVEVLNALDSMLGKWNQGNWFNSLRMRINYGVSWELVDICRLSGIGKVKANKLWNAGLKSIKDIANNLDKVKMSLKCSDDVARKIVNDAKLMIMM